MAAAGWMEELFGVTPAVQITPIDGPVFLAAGAIGCRWQTQLDVVGFHGQGPW